MAETAPSVAKPDLHGSINHVSITVSDLPEAVKFFGPLLEFLGYTFGAVQVSRAGAQLTVNLKHSDGIELHACPARRSRPRPAGCSARRPPARATGRCARRG